MNIVKDSSNYIMKCICVLEKYICIFKYNGSIVQSTVDSEYFLLCQYIMYGTLVSSHQSMVIAFISEAK